jgi:hypothetical protein
MTSLLRCIGLLAGLGLVAGPAARGGTSLTAKSPFLPANAAVDPGSAEATPLELRGILADAGGYRFSIYDPARHTGQWVRLNEPGHDFTVRTHDVARDTVTLDYQGRVLTLPLRTAKVTGLAVTEPAAGTATGPRPTAGAPGFGSGPVPRPPTPEETARYNRAVEEIARRRALREKGPVPLPGPTPGQMPGPAPGPAPK